MNSSPDFLRINTLLSCPAWVRVAFAALLVGLLAALTAWAMG